MSALQRARGQRRGGVLIVALLFNRSGLTDVPPGFVPQVILRYDPSSYSEAVL
jgi:hypothetical protein